MRLLANYHTALFLSSCFVRACTSPTYSHDSIIQAPVGAHAGTRTPDPRIKSPLLYRLSYMSILCRWADLNRPSHLSRWALSHTSPIGTGTLAGMAGIEPANEGVKVPCLGRLATSLYISYQLCAMDNACEYSWVYSSLVNVSSLAAASMISSRASRLSAP